MKRKEPRRWHWYKIYCNERIFSKIDDNILYSYPRGINYKPNSNIVYLSTTSYTYAELLEDELKKANIKYQKKKLTYSEILNQEG